MAVLAYRRPIAEGSVNMMECDSPRANRVKGFLKLQWSLSLCCALLVVLVLACHLCRVRSDKRLDTQGWQMTDFLEHLQKHGVQLHVVPAAEDGALSSGVYLTEEPDATRASMECKPKAVECIHQWRGTVWVGRAHLWFNAEDHITQWHEYGCRIGDFILFGDELLLRRIQEACR
jgi:hypothetical protein